MTDRYAVELFRARFLVLQARDGVTLNDVAERMGWMRSGAKQGRPAHPDATRVARVLGLRAYRSNAIDGQMIVREYVGYDLAVRLCDALELDYTEVGV